MKIKGKSKDPKRTEADQKRILSMVEMKKEYNQKKSLIKHALSNVVCMLRFLLFYGTYGGFLGF